MSKLAVCTIDSNGIQGKPGEPAGLPIFAKETPVFHHFIVILPLWPKNLLPALPKIIMLRCRWLRAQFFEFRWISSYVSKNVFIDGTFNVIKLGSFNTPVIYLLTYYDH